MHVFISQCFDFDSMTDFEGGKLKENISESDFDLIKPCAIRRESETMNKTLSEF